MNLQLAQGAAASIIPNSGAMSNRAEVSAMLKRLAAFVIPALALLACGVMLGIFLMQTRTAGTISV